MKAKSIKNFDGPFFWTEDCEPMLSRLASWVGVQYQRKMLMILIHVRQLVSGEDA